MKIWETEIFGRKLKVEHGKMAKQSHGSILLTFNESSILTTVNASENAKPGIDFFPLTVEFKEKFYAVGKIPGGFVKREGKPSDEAILSSRLIDRPIRPLFPEGFFNEVQVIETVFSMFSDDSIETWGITGASLALNLSPIPFEGAAAGVRVAYVDGKYVVFPTQEELKRAKLDIVVAGIKDAVTMVEGESLEVTEEEMLNAILFAHDAIKQIIKFQEEIISEIAVEKWEIETVEKPEEFINKFVATIDEKILLERILVKGKKDRDKAIGGYKEELIENFKNSLGDSVTEEEFKERIGFAKEEFENLVKKLMRRSIIENDLRADGRKSDEIRPITCEVGLFPRLHGSALFTRGETQSLGIVTLGAPVDVQMVDTIFSDEDKRFMLHYNFPPFSTGEVKPLRGISRREIGHGHLAERSHKNLIPSEDVFPYTIRVVSEILESNGSSSMASVCSASLALMDAGVPIKQHVAGIAMGLIFDDDKFVVLSDIQGMEDHLGDMDFKVTGTRKGITAFQMDVKVAKVNEAVLKVALEKARVGRDHILGLMENTIKEPREDVSKYVPIIMGTNIPVDKIGEVIGPGGRVIKDINKTFNVDVDINDSGMVKVIGDSKENVRNAVSHIDNMVRVVKKGEMFTGKVTRIENYGLFVEVLPGKTGLLHVSNMGKKPAELKLGQEIEVEVLNVEDANKFQLKEKGYEKKRREFNKNKETNEVKDKAEDKTEDKTETTEKETSEKENGGN